MAIRITQARVHNLKSVSLDLPSGQLVVLAGPSGSGKSSLAHGVLYEAWCGSKVDAQIEHLPKRILLLEQRVTALAGQSLGESNRARLTTLLTKARKGDWVIADEPCVGLARPERLAVVAQLRAALKEGVSVLLIEHSPDVIKAADYVIEFGPEAGAKGGFVVFAGKQKAFAKANTFTSRFVYAAPPRHFPKAGKASKKELVLKGVDFAPFKDATFRFPLHKLVCVCGPVGAGKSRFLEVAYGALFKGKNAWKLRPRLKSIEGKTYVRRSYFVDQSLLSRISTSSPATFLGIWTEIRKLFAATSESRRRHLDKSAFNLRAPANAARAAVRLKGLCIEDVLKLTVDEAAAFFALHPLIVRKLGFLQEVGLGYLSLAQKSATLSGGEAQRVRLAKILSKKLGDRCLYILDTPSRGLHPADGPVLGHVLRRIIDKNNSILLAENREDIQAACDVVLEMRNLKLA